jgi:3-phenylpropionate/trans-cinnamate dioxygenase ferredoxin reductase subunit
MVGAEHELPYDRPPLSKQVVRGEREVVLFRDEYESLEVDLRLGVAAKALDVEARVVTLEDSTTLTYDAVVVATGATPRLMPGTEDFANVHVLRTAAEARVLRDALRSARHLTVIGGGFIGCEVAASARQLDIDVTLVEVLQHPLVRVLGHSVASLVEQMHVDHGVDVHADTSVDAFVGDGRVTSIRLVDGAAFDTDVVLAGLGVTPDVAWLEGSGLELDNGVVCDRYGAAGPDVWAVGDVARWHHVGTGAQHRLEHWTNAAEMAAAVARNVLAEPDEREPYAPIAYVWSDQYDVKIQSVGFYRADDAVTLLTVGPKQRQLALYGRDGRLTGAVGFSAAKEIAAIRRLLGEGGSVEDALALVEG